MNLYLTFHLFYLVLLGFEISTPVGQVEMSLHFSTLLSARLTWDSRVKELLDDIKTKIKNTVGYMAENMRDDLMNREFRKVTPVSTWTVCIMLCMRYRLPPEQQINFNFFQCNLFFHNACHPFFFEILLSHLFSSNLPPPVPPFPFSLQPGVTAELYTNASLSIQRDMPELYAKIRPEVRFAHESFFIQDESEIRRYVMICDAMCCWCGV